MPEFPAHCIGVAAGVDERLGLVSLVFPYDSPSTLQTDAEHLAWCMDHIPSPAPIEVPIVKRAIKQRPDGGYRLELTYEGHRSPTTADGEEFSLEGTLKEEPIESNPNIDQIAQIYFGKEQEDGRIIFPRTVVIDNETRTNPLGGLKAFRDPGLIWTRTFVSVNFPVDLLDALGTIDQPLTKEGIRPPELRGKRNWLLIRVSAEWRGNIWKISQRWELSGRGGWNRYVYPRT